MSSLWKLAPIIRWRIVAALACVTLAASPGLAARRHAPHAGQPAAQGAVPAGAASAPAGQAKPEAGETSTPVDATASKTPPTGPAGRGGKATDAGSKSAGPIDLTRPDDGFGNGNLRRRAARTSLIAAQKKPQGIPAATTTPHPPASATAEHPRNAAGAAAPAVSAVPAAFGAAKPEPVHAEPATAFGGAKNNLGLGAASVHPATVHVATPPASPKPPVPGINGTSLHQAGPGIGGPAKDHSAIAGSSYRHK
jgi:hypothetical protein